MTVSPIINFVDAAEAMSYHNVFYVHNLQELSTVFYDWQKTPKLTFVYLRITQGTLDNLKRPNITPEAIKTRFRSNF